MTPELAAIFTLLLAGSVLLLLVLLASVLRVAERLSPRQPRYRYFQHGQHMFCFTTEKMGDGKYASFIYQPEGIGARSKKRGRHAESWTPRREVRHRTRKAAHARALKLYTAAKGAA